MSTPAKSLTAEVQQVIRAMTLIKLGARMQVLESEFPMLSRDRLTRLYREIKGASPPKGMLPFSADWYLTWGPNIHASMFANIFDFLGVNTSLDRVDMLSRAYALYAEHFEIQEEPLLMDLTRAWTLLRFMDAGILKLAPCTRCAGRFLTHAQDLTDGMVCGICAPPSRAGKTRAAKRKELNAVEAEAVPVERACA